MDVAENVAYWQMITGVSSSAIALLALGTAIWQGVSTRRHNRLSCRPHLTCWEGTDWDECTFKVLLVNNGVGPAFIKKFTVKLDGNAIPGYDCAPLDEAIETIFNGFSREQYSSYVGTGYAMGVGEKNKLIDLKFKDGHMPDEDSIRDRIRKVDIVIGYENLYGEKFEYSSYQELLMRDG